MTEGRHLVTPFLVLGIAFLAIGVSTNRVFLALGVVFIALALKQKFRR